MGELDQFLDAVEVLLENSARRQGL
jgi:hypothetical protein